MKNKINAVFLGIVWLIMAAGLCRAVLCPKEMSSEENRYANRLTRPTLSSFFDGSFQDGVEAALSDQALGSGMARSGCNLVSSGINEALLSGLYAANQDRYIRIGEGLSSFGGYLVYDTRELKKMAPGLDRGAGEINAFAASHPDVPVYAYYIEKDTDINFETGEKPGLYGYLAERLALPPANVSAFRIDSFEDYAGRFFRTDHHWDYRGSYQGYREVLELLDGGIPLEPVGEVTLDRPLSGSKAIESGGKGVRTEDFTAYRFEYPPMSVTVNGSAAGDYGAQEAWINGSADGELSYGSFYGGDFGEVVFDTGSGGENLLVLGESHDNAIIKLLAANFGRTYSVDLRYYEVQTGRKFSLGEYVEANGIDKVLFIGSIGFYTSDDLILED